ncbi:pectinesterase family protein [Herpetosiphon giganteus]|uniref:pectinesterase family protein n=1 Tax=Herpetosiphon giganteus TaxID=2029754 RepID=UPI00195DCC24|nr:pectinesterase family protein [Herpetosiphon giganteus]MBM7843219.1 pectin methylesterase-like acyl-CoA thioesterase [Herpetosiphon giganteus]
MNQFNRRDFLRRLGFVAIGIAASQLDLAPVAGQTTSIVVAKDGSGAHTTVQAAINAVPTNNPNRVVIFIKNGTYKEVITIPNNKPKITLYGQSRDGTVLTYDNYASKTKPDGTTYGTSGSASCYFYANDCNATNLTIQNSSGNVGQAVALYASGDRLNFRNVRLLGYQDTLYSNAGRQYYNNCLIQGAVDFIFGNATAVFDTCQIVSNGQGYITAHSRTASNQTTGYVFTNCTVSGSSNTLTYLGRPWRPYARVIFLNSNLGSHVRPAGWDNWGNSANEATAYYGEQGNTGGGASLNNRVGWMKKLTSQQAQSFSTATFLNNDGWLTTSEQYLSGLIQTGFPGTTPNPTPAPTGYFKLINRQSGKALDVAAKSTSNGGNVQQWADNGGANQQWQIVDVGSGFKKIINRHSGLALEVAAGSKASGANVQQWSYGGTAHQQWQVLDAGGGYIYVVNRNSQQALDVAAGSGADGANVQQWGYAGGAWQQWQLIAI